MHKTFQDYDKFKENPPIPRDLPPVAGKIAWARQLNRRIRDPMNYFERHASVLKKREAIRITHHFNKVAEILTRYEMLYQSAWEKDVNIIKTGKTS